MLWPNSGKLKGERQNRRKADRQYSEQMSEREICGVERGI